MIGTRAWAGDPVEDHRTRPRLVVSLSGEVDRQVATCITFGGMDMVFKALADPTRRTILDELTDRNGQTLFEICARLTTKHGLASSRQAISQHLDVLAAAGLVETSRAGRYKFHYINITPLEPIVERWLRKAGRGHHEDQRDERAR
jgi:DNA-binding transcriptional ArsR family regulator